MIRIGILLFAITFSLVGCSNEYGKPELSVNITTLLFSGVSESKSFEITSNTDWTITGHETQVWISAVSPISGNGNETVYVTVEANPSAVVSRNATLTLSAKGVALVTIFIDQQKRPIPEITSFEPIKAKHGALISIFGKNFSTVKEENTVQFNGFTAEVISATTDIIQSIVPKNLNCGGKISVTVGETTVLSTDVFTYLQTITVSSLAGSNTIGFANGAGNIAQFNLPCGITTVSDDIYVADYDNHRIRKVSLNGDVSTFAGSGIMGFADGTSDIAQFYYPSGVAVDASNNVYVADCSNCRIRKITNDGIVTTLAGNGKEGFANGEGTVAQFDSPNNVAVDALGNVYVADTGNHSIRKITSAGVVTTLAGNGTAGFADGSGSTAQFNYPIGIAVDALGNVYVGDRLNHRIRKITPTGMVSTLAGTGGISFADGQSNVAKFNHPNGVTVDALGNVYVADWFNHRIRKISPTGEVTTLAGDGTAGFRNGTGESARFCFPEDLVVNDSGNFLYVADGNNHRIRKITIE